MDTKNENLKLFVAEVASTGEMDFVLAETVEEAIGFMIEALVDDPDSHEYYRDPSNWEIYERDRIIHYEDKNGQMVTGTVADWLGME